MNRNVESSSLAQLPLANPPISWLCEKSLPFLSFSLIGEEYQEKIKTFCRCLSPAWTTSQVGFECSLSSQQNWGDFHCLVNIQEIDQNIGFEDLSWGVMASLLNEWRATGFLEENQIRRTILEFDIGSSLIWPPKPNICLLFAPHHKDPLVTIANMLSPLKEKKYVLDTLNQFLSKGWIIDGIGLMLARSDCLRILFRTKSSVDALVDFFTELGLFRVVGVLLDVFGTFPIDPFLFEIDENEKGMISPRVGIDIPPRNALFPVESILEKLYLKNLVDQGKMNSLLSWIGIDKELDPLCQPRSSSIDRDIHHFKLICSPHQEPSVKAYLSSCCVAKAHMTKGRG